MGDWRRQGPQSGPQRLSPSSAMLEPLPVEFGTHAGGPAAVQRPLHLGSSAFSPVPGAHGPSPQSRAAFGDRDGNAAGRQSPGLDRHPSLHGTTQPEVCISYLPQYTHIATPRALVVALAPLGGKDASADIQMVACPTCLTQLHVQGHRYDGMEPGSAPQGDVSGSPRYGAPVTTGHDKQQTPAQAHGPPDRLNASSAQVLRLPN